MSDVHLDESLLNRYFDGELSQAESARAEAHLGGCDQCSAEHRALSKLREIITVAAVDIADQLDTEALFGRIEAGTAKQAEPPFLERMRVWWGEFIEHHTEVWMPASAAVAAAAVVAVVVLGGGHPDTGATPGERAAPGVEPAPTARTLPKPKPKMMLANSEVVDVDFGENAGTVFEIALADGVSTPVVWINDELEE